MYWAEQSESEFIFIWAKAESYDIFENLGAVCKQRQRCLNHRVVCGCGKQTSSTEPFPAGYPSDGRIIDSGAWASPRRGEAVFPGREAVSSSTVHFSVFQRGSAGSVQRWMDSSTAEPYCCGQRLRKKSEHVQLPKSYTFAQKTHEMLQIPEIDIFHIHIFQHVRYCL